MHNFELPLTPQLVQILQAGMQGKTVVQGQGALNQYAFADFGQQRVGHRHHRREPIHAAAQQNHQQACFLVLHARLRQRRQAGIGQNGSGARVLNK